MNMLRLTFVDIVMHETRFDIVNYDYVIISFFTEGPLYVIYMIARNKSLVQEWQYLIILYKTSVFIGGSFVSLFLTLDQYHLLTNVNKNVSLCIDQY